MAETETFEVVGMTCEHCVSAVRGELAALAGVTDVEVDLASGRVSVTSAEPLEAAALEAAVDEAGYEIAR
ncbi:MAG: cation transporter [Microthrixaceae bacterium]